MCYNGFIKTQTSNCYQCGSPTVLVSKKTEKIEGQMFPMTTLLFRCTNKACQDEKDKAEQQRLKLAKERELASKERAGKRLKEKKMFLRQSPKN